MKISRSCRMHPQMYRIILRWSFKVHWLSREINGINKFLSIFCHTHSTSSTIISQQVAVFSHFHSPESTFIYLPSGFRCRRRIALLSVFVLTAIYTCFIHLFYSVVDVFTIHLACILYGYLYCNYNYFPYSMKYTSVYLYLSLG